MIKKQIILNYIVPKTASIYNLEKITIEDEALNILVDEYSVSLGVRDCEKDIDRVIIHKIQAADRDVCKVVINSEDIRDSLGYKRTDGLYDVPTGEEMLPGQAQALGVSGNYGSCFAIQTMINEYQKDEVKVTGLPEGSCAESIADAMFLASRYLKRKLPNLYIHMTNAGVKKDGPSAGLTIFCSIMSCMLKKPLPNVAFTGTIDPLYASVGIVGGIEEKITAAERKGISKVYIPSDNYEKLKAEGKLGRFRPEIVPVRFLPELLMELFSYQEEKGEMTI